MYTTAPNYLSGVSVFLGDGISKRVITGEVAFFIGQAVQGPTVPVVLSSIDAAISLYGNSPLLKGLYEFNDGFIDSPRANTLQLVSLRVGGVMASLTTTFGVTIETSDAYDGIEDDFYVYINNNPGALTIKAWNKNGSKSFRYSKWYQWWVLNNLWLFNCSWWSVSVRTLMQTHSIHAIH